MAVPVGAGADAVGVTGMPTGTSSTQLLPGARVIGAPPVVVSVAGWVRTGMSNYSTTAQRGRPNSGCRSSHSDTGSLAPKPGEF